MAKTSAFITLMDYTDGISIISSIDSNLPLTSLYDTSTQQLNPSWAGNISLILTPIVTKAGSSESLVENMTNVVWYRRLAGADWVQITSGQNNETIGTNKALTVKKDWLLGDVWQIDFKFTGTYTDPVLNLPMDVEVVRTFSRVANGTSFVVARAYPTGGSQFKNNAPASLSIVAELIRGTEKDSTNLSYQWAKTTNGTSWSNMSGKTSSTLSIGPSDVEGFAAFKCTIKDNDSASDTYNQSFTTEAVSITDVSDPYQCVIFSSAGTYFKNNTGSTQLTCKVYQNGQEVDAGGTSFSYAWTQTDKDGNAVSGFAKTGKTITVSHDNIDVKGSFFCEVS